MSRIISLDCDQNEVRIAVGAVGLTGVSLEHVVSAPIKLEANEDPIGNPKTLQALQGLLKQIGIKSGTTNFCVGRNTIELRSITLPSVDKNELPDMVRFAALRQFANVGDNWPIDFVTMPSEQDGMTDCLAASINPNTIERINRMVDSLGLTLSQIVLRQMASASLLTLKQPALVGKTVLLIEMFQDEVDMAVLDAGNVVFMRNVRFAHTPDHPSSQRALQGEIKRTLLAAASQRANLKVDEVRVWGNSTLHSDLCQGLARSLELPVHPLNPLDLVEANKTTKDVAGDRTSHYASVIGALFTTQTTDRLIDFSNPRKREERKTPVRTYALAGTAAAVLALGGYGWHWSNHSELDQKIAELQLLTEKNKEPLKIAAKKIADWEKVEDFLEGDYQWLNELEYLSSKAPDPDSAVFGNTTFSIDTRSNAGKIATQFLTNEQDNVPKMQENLRNPDHSVRSTKVVKSQDKTGKFPHSADLAILLAPNKVKDPRVSSSKKETPKAKNEEKATPIPEKPSDPPPVSAEIKSSEETI